MQHPGAVGEGPEVQDLRQGLEVVHPPVLHRVPLSEQEAADRDHPAEQHDQRRLVELGLIVADADPGAEQHHDQPDRGQQLGR